MSAAFAFTPFEATNGTTSPYQDTYASAVSAGSVLFCFTVQYNDTQTCTGVSDSVNGAWTLAFGPVRSHSATMGYATLYGWYRLNSASGTPQVSATWSGNATGGIVIGEITGLSGGGALDQEIHSPDSAIGSLSTLSAGTAATLAQSIEAVVAYVVSQSSKTGQSLTADVSPAYNYYEYAQRSITSSTSAPTVTWTASSLSPAFAAGAMFFKDGGGGGSPHRAAMLSGII